MYNLGTVIHVNMNQLSKKVKKTLLLKIATIIKSIQERPYFSYANTNTI